MTLTAESKLVKILTNLKLMTRLTGVVDVDIEILSRLDDKSLRSFCQTNRHARDLCQDEELWKKRLQTRFGLNHVTAKPEGISFHQWYQVWIGPRSPIGELFNFGIKEEGIRRLTQKGGIIEGSELYLTIDQCLIRAFQSNQPDLITYFWRCYLRLRSRVKTGDAGITLDFEPILDAAIEAGFEDDLGMIVEAIQQDNSPGMWNKLSILGHLTRTLARQGRKDLIIRYTDSKTIASPTIPRAEYICGLIEGSYFQQAAVEINTRLYSLTSDDYESIVKVCLQNGQEDLLEVLNQKFPANTDPHLRAFAIGALEAGFPDLATPYENLLTPNQIVTALAQSRPDLALTYLQTSYDGNPTVRFRTESWDLLEYCIRHNYNNVTPSANADFATIDLFCRSCRSETLAYYIFESGNYSMLEKYQDKFNQTSTVFSKETNYKDILLYFLSGIDNQYMNFQNFGDHLEVNRIIRQHPTQNSDFLLILQTSVGL